MDGERVPAGPRWFGRRIHIGLRDRVVIGFGLLALGLSVVLAAAVWFFVSGYLIDQRESTAVVESTVNAEAIDTELARDNGTIPALLDRIPSRDASVTLLNDGGEWYATSPNQGPDVLPAGLVSSVRSSVAATQRTELNGRVVLAVGIPAEQTGDGYYAIFPLEDLHASLRTLAIALVVSALATSVVGMFLGGVASRVALRPLAELTPVAAAVARGDMGARLRHEEDPDLGALARSFNHTVESLQRRVVADARFAGDVSHELRTPLTTMLNSMQLIQNRESELPDRVREPVRMLAAELERFRRLVVDLLEISRDDAHDDPSTREQVLLAELVRRAADHAAGRAVTEVSSEADRTWMRVDKRRLEMVVANLVQNAEDHGGGCVRVGVSIDQETARLEIDDAGPGIDAERRERIFERFARGGSTEAGGVGLGLAIVDRHVQWHSGSIRIDDRPGGGARFVVTLPREGPADEQ